MHRWCGEAAKNIYAVESLVPEAVNSAPFQMRKAAALETKFAADAKR
jgi:hypothetical protein